MAGKIAKIFNAIMGRETPEDAARRKAFDAAVDDLDAVRADIGKTADGTRVWANGVKERCSDRRNKRAEEKAKKAAEATRFHPSRERNEFSAEGEGEGEGEGLQRQA